jgi:hypothetical protein
MTTEAFHTEYDPAQDHAWHLGCWLAPGLQAWCVHDRRNGKLMALAAAPGDSFPLAERLPQRPASVSFTAMPEVGTLVPESALAPGTEMRHLAMVHGTVPTGLLRDEPIGLLDARCIYLHDETAERKLLEQYPNARSLPLQGTLVNHALARSAAGAVAVVLRSSSRMDLAIAERGKLLLCNTFHATVPDDLLYYTLFCLERCGIAPAAVELRVGGTHLAPTEEHLLSNYFARGATPTTAPDDAVLNGLQLPQAHHWTGLTEQFPCAS